MKAKEYAARITSLQNPELSDIMKELGRVGKDFYNEFVAVKKQRKLQMDNSFFALVLEFDKKFQAFARLVNEKYKVEPVRPDGFIEILKSVDPQIVPYIEIKYLIYKSTHA